MLQNTKKVFKIQPKRSVAPITQPVQISVPGCIVPPCAPAEDSCALSFIGTLYTTYMGDSLIVGAQLFEDELATIPLTNSFFSNVRTQLAGEAPNSTIVNFNLGEVIDVLFTCT